MGEFQDNMAEALDDALTEMGTTVYIRGNALTAIVDDTPVSSGNVLGGRGSRVAAEIHVKKTAFDGISGKKGDRVEFNGVQGRIVNVTHFSAGHYTLTVGNPNQRHEL